MIRTDDTPKRHYWYAIIIQINNTGCPFSGMGNQMSSDDMYSAWDCEISLAEYMSSRSGVEVVIVSTSTSILV